MGELRAMVYTAVVAGATGIFYFAKEDSDASPPVVLEYVHVGSAQPRSSYMWSEARRLAFELVELGPSVISPRPRPMASSSTPGIEVGAWAEADGSTLLILVNLAADPRASAVASVTLSECPASATADVLFGQAPRNITVAMQATAGPHPSGTAATAAAKGGASCAVTLHDVVDGLGTRIYRLRPPRTRAQPTPVAEPTTDPHAGNLIFNGGFEASTSGPGSADGVWAAWGGDGSATQLTDTAHVQQDQGLGRHSMRITTPARGRGLRLWYASRAVQFHPHGGQFDFVWLSARTPHGAYVW